MTTTSQLYDSDASEWQRTEPVLLTDFTARPYVMRLASRWPGAACSIWGGLRDQPLHVAFRLRVE